jgi:hypothetical protein
VKLAGDIYIKLINAKNGNLICRFAINTAFIPEVKDAEGLCTYTLDKKGVDPDSILNNNKFDNKFKIELKFQDVCKVCKPSKELVYLCDKCK